MLRDYCLVDEFIAECPSGSTIMMEEAQYGRMQLGTCLKRDFGYMDCSRYVLSVSHLMLMINLLHDTWICSSLKRLFYVFSPQWCSANYGSILFWATVLSFKSCPIGRFHESLPWYAQLFTGEVHMSRRWVSMSRVCPSQENIFLPVC